jgi:hypothetical protein
MSEASNVIPVRFPPGRLRLLTCARSDYCHPATNQIGSKGGKAIQSIFGESIFNKDIRPFNVTGFAETGSKSIQWGCIPLL